MTKNNICYMTLGRHFSVTGDSSKTDLTEQQACTHTVKQAWRVMLISAEPSFSISNKYFILNKRHLKRNNFLRKQQQNQKAPTDTMRDSNFEEVEANPPVISRACASRWNCLTHRSHLWACAPLPDGEWDTSATNLSHHCRCSHHTTASCPQHTEHSQLSIWWTLHNCYATIIYCTFTLHYICCYKSHLLLHTQAFT